MRGKKREREEEEEKHMETERRSRNKEKKKVKARDGEPSFNHNLFNSLPVVSVSIIVVGAMKRFDDVGDIFFLFLKPPCQFKAR